MNALRRFLYKRLLAMTPTVDPREHTPLHIPIMDADGDRAWLEMRYVPTDRELEWALHDSEHMREAYAVLVLVKARGAVEYGDYAQVGWSSEEGYG